MPDAEVLTVLADEMDVFMGLRRVEAARTEIGELGPWDGARAEPPAAQPTEPPMAGEGQAVLATWHLMLDAGRGQDGEPHLAGTARRPVARLSAETAAAIGVADGADVTVTRDGLTGDGGTGGAAITLPAEVTEMPDYVVWLPTRSVGSPVRAALRADAGTVVTLSAGDTSGGTE